MFGSPLFEDPPIAPVTSGYPQPPASVGGIAPPTVAQGPFPTPPHFGGTAKPPNEYPPHAPPLVGQGGAADVYCNRQDRITTDWGCCIQTSAGAFQVTWDTEDGLPPCRTSDKHEQYCGNSLMPDQLSPLVDMSHTNCHVGYSFVSITYCPTPPTEAVGEQE